MPLLIGIDLGTTSVKSGLFDAEGNLRALARSPYPISSPKPAWAEQNPNLWWTACTRTVAEITSRVDPNEILGLSVVAQAPTLVCVDKNAEPTRPAMIWADRRALPEARELSAKTGSEMDPSFNLPKALWVRRKDREVYNRTRWFLQAADYLMFKLTGQPVALMVVPGQPPWPDEHISAAELDKAKIPERTCKISENIGRLSSFAAEATGLKAGLPVIAGTVDSFSAWIGTATLDKGQLCNECGFTAGVALCWDRQLIDPMNSVQSIRHPAGKNWIVGGAMSTGSKFLDWFAENFYSHRTGIKGMLADAKSIPAGSEGLVALPYLMGERAPINDVNARGVFFGIAPHHTKAHFARAVLEAVAFAVRDTCRALEEVGGEIYEVRLAGAGARSHLWNQIRAAVLGKKVSVPEVADSALLGSSVIAAAGLGIYSSLDEAARKMVKIKHVIEPDDVDQRKYAELFEIYRATYAGLKENFSRLGELQVRNGDR